MEQRQINTRLVTGSVIGILVAIAGLALGLLHQLIIIEQANAQPSDQVYYWLQQESDPFQYSIEDYKRFEQQICEVADYYELYGQYLERLDDDKAPYYDIETGTIDTEGQMIPSIQLNARGQDLLALSAAEGRLFSDRDFALGTDADVAVLLGNGYRNLYHVGDSFQMRYLYSEVTCKVIGILNADNGSDIGGRYYDINSSIIMPMFDIDENNLPVTLNLNGMKIHYANRISGVAVYNQGSDKEAVAPLKELIEQSSCGIMTYSVNPASVAIYDETGIPIAVWMILCVMILLLAVLAARALRLSIRQCESSWGHAVSFYSIGTAVIMLLFGKWAVAYICGWKLDLPRMVLGMIVVIFLTGSRKLLMCSSVEQSG